MDKQVRDGLIMHLRQGPGERRALAQLYPAVIVSKKSIGLVFQTEGPSGGAREKG